MQILKSEETPKNTTFPVGFNSIFEQVIPRQRLLLNDSKLHYLIEQFFNLFIPCQGDCQA